MTYSMGVGMWKITFALDRASPVEAHTTTQEGLRLAVTLGEAHITVEGIKASGEDEARDRAVREANGFLSTLSWKYGADMALADGPWQAETPAPDGTKHASVHVAGNFVATGRAYANRPRQNGGAGQDWEGADSLSVFVSESEAANYFRKARLSSDPFDRFRNFYLAAENIADRIRCNKKLPQQRERSLLEIALKECFRGGPEALREIASQAPGFHATGDLFADVARFLYEGHRCQLNHSKASRDKRVPYNPKDEKAVGAALPLVESVAKELLAYEEKHL